MKKTIVEDNNGNGVVVERDGQIIWLESEHERALWELSTSQARCLAKALLKAAEEIEK